MMPPVQALIALGSNLGDRAGFLAFGRNELAAHPEVRLMAQSIVEETRPLGGLVQPDYLNQMVLVETTLAARTLLALCHDIERASGRRRGEKWASRTLDLDLVRYASLMCDLPDLVLPHPGLRDRPFWATEIARMESHA